MGKLCQGVVASIVCHFALRGCTDDGLTQDTWERRVDGQP